MNDNQIPKDIYVDSTADCISFAGSCYIRDFNQLGPITHESDLFVELENCINCISDPVVFDKGNTILVYKNECLEFSSNELGFYGTLNLHTGITTVTYKISLTEDGFSLEEQFVDSGFAGINYIEPEVSFGSSTVFKSCEMQYKIEATKNDAGKPALCFTKDPYNKSCNSLLAFTTFDFDPQGFQDNNIQISKLRVSVKPTNGYNADITQDFDYSNPIAFARELHYFIEEHFKSGYISIQCDVNLTQRSSAPPGTLFSIVSFWRANSNFPIGGSDVSISSIDEDGNISLVQNNFQKLDDSDITVSNYDLDLLPNFLDDTIYGRNQSPKYSFEISLDNNELVDNFIYGDDIVLTFLYDKEYTYNTQMHKNIKEGLQHISKFINIDFHKKIHGVYSAVEYNEDTNTIVLDVWAPCSFHLISECNLNIVKNSITVKKIGSKDVDYPAELLGDYRPDGGAFSLLAPEDSEDLIEDPFWGQYIISSDSFNDKPVYRLESATEDAASAPSVIWINNKSSWILLKDGIETTYNLGSRSTPFSDTPIGPQNLIFSPGYNGLPTFSNGKGFYIFGKDIKYEDELISPEFHITDIRYKKIGSSFTISQDIDFIKKLCKYSIQ